MQRTFQAIVLLVVAGVGYACERSIEDQPASLPEPDKASSQPAAGGGEAKDFELTNFKWDGPMSAGDSLQIRNPYGDIRLRKSGTQELVVSAQIQTFTDWQAPPEIRVIENDGRFEVVIEHDQPVKAPFGGDYQAGFAGRIDVTVLLPPDTRARLHTTDGTLRVKGFSGDLAAQTMTGNIDYRGKGQFDLYSREGSITAFVDDFRTRLPGEIETAAGAATLKMPQTAKVTVEAESAGQIEFVAPPDFKAGKHRGHERLQLKIGGGGRALKVHSDTGNITIEIESSAGD